MRTKLIVASLVLAGGLILPTASQARVGVFVDIAPPVAVVETPPPPPRVGYVWAPGYYAWQGGAHVWVPGRYIEPRVGYHWVPDHWRQRGPHYYFVPGHWAP
jgi:hypothetical protein